MDAITESLMREASNFGKRATDAAPSNLVAELTQRSAEMAKLGPEAAAIRNRELMPNGGGMIPVQALTGREPQTLAIENEPSWAASVGGSSDKITPAMIQRGDFGAPTAAAPAAQPSRNVDPITASLLAEAERKPITQIATSSVGGSLADRVPGSVQQPEYKEPSLLDKALGSHEAGLSLVTGALAAPVAAIGGVASNLLSGKFGTREGTQVAQDRFKDILGSLTYQPRTEGGKSVLGSIASALDASKLAGLGPTEAMTVGGLAAAPAKIAPTSPLAATKPPMQGLAPQLASVGAAAMEPKAQAMALVANASPEIKGAAEAAIKSAGNNVNLNAIKRHVEADSLPVKVDLTQGQATGDIVKLSNEQNRRAANPDVARRFNEQNKALVENTNAIRELAAPDVFVNTKPAIGELPINAYKAKDAALNADISAKYKALKDANGGAFPIDVKQLLSATEQALKADLKTRFVPPELRLTLKDIAKNGAMSFEDFESLRTITARIQRSPSADGNAKQAAAIIREQLENLPLTKGAEGLKALADDARAAAKSRADFFSPKSTKYDPAYKAVVEGKASADHFIDKYLIGQDLKYVERMKANLAHDPVAQQALPAGAMNYLKSSAGIIDDAGNFSQAGYNKALDSIRPKLGVIFEVPQKQQVETLGNVARYTQEQPRGSFVNNSNTLVGFLGETAATTAEGVANVAAHGVPVGTWTRKLFSGNAEKKTVQDMLRRGAGMK